MDIVRAVGYVIFVLLEVILLFNLLIVVHELGHFLAARWRGLVVEQFAVWFGRPLWSRTYKGVLYSLGSIPFGGFVKLPQMAPMDAIEGESTTDQAQLPPVSPLNKIIVAIAGPLFSLGLAFVFAVVIWGVGHPLSQGEKTTVIGYVVPDGPAAKAKSDVDGVVGMQAGDEILAVDGHKISRFFGMNRSVIWYVARSEGATIPFEIERGGKTINFYPKPEDSDSQDTDWYQRKALRQVLIDPAFESIVASVAPGSPAAVAGLQKGDVITAVNGQAIYNPHIISDQELASMDTSLRLTVRRDGETKELMMPPVPFTLGSVLEGSPADKSGGLKIGDVITAINGVAPKHFSDLKEAILAHPDAPVELTISHDGGQPQIAKITPLVPRGEKNAVPMIGVGPDYEADGIGWVEGGTTELVTEDPVEQVEHSVSSIANTIGAVIAPKSKIGLQHLGGPLMIGRTYFALLTSPNGWRLALWFSVVLNVNLALLNMLPIPVLDGGHVLLALIESIRRKPVNLRLLEIVQTACFILIAGYMLFVSFYDVGDLFGGHKSRREVEFASPSPATTVVKP